MYATVPDLLRLLAVPVLGWAAWSDIRTRRVPNRTWLPLAALGVVLLLWEGYLAAIGSNPDFFLRAAISLGFVVPLVTAFWWMGGFGGADAKAFYVVALLFPTYPYYYLSAPLPAETLPLEPTPVGVFSLTVLSNTVLVGAAYPLAVALGNLLRGHVGLPMLIGKPVSVSRLPEEYGILLQTPDGYTRRGLDLDALRMYLQWRGTSLSALLEDPEGHRDPASLPADPNPPGDGSIATDGGEVRSGAATDDPWGAEAFLDDIEGNAYGTTPERLREGLAVLTSEEVVWVSPGIPFIVPMFVGLLVSLVYGDVLFTAVAALAF